MVVNQTFWKNKTVLITGHTGFKGGWLSLWLSQLGANVVGYALAPPSTPSFFVATQLENHLHSIIGDVRDAEFFAKSVKHYQPEIIFHLAAQSLVRPSYQNPIETYATNVMGTVHVLDAARQCDSVRALVNVTTDKCYANREWVWSYRETDTLGGHDPYSNSKACSELVTDAFRSAFFNEKKTLGLASARAGNVIGGGDWSQDRLLPDIISAYYAKQPVVIRYPDAIRPWQHVLEPLSGYLLLAEKLYAEPQRFSQAWNFGPEQNDIKSVRWIVERMRKLMGNDVSWQLSDAVQPHEAQLLKLDSAKAKTHLAWYPHWPLEKTLDQTLHWYTAYYGQENVFDLSVKQLQQYSTQQFKPFTIMEKVEHV